MGTRTGKLAIWVALTVAVGVVATALILRARHASVTLTGVVLRQDSDPRKQLPIANVKITATEGERSAEGESDASGLFRLTLPNGGWREQPVLLTFQHPGYQPMDMTPRMKGELYIARMTSLPAQAAPAGVHEIAVKD